MKAKDRRVGEFNHKIEKLTGTEVGYMIAFATGEQLSVLANGKGLSFTYKIKDILKCKNRPDAIKKIAAIYIHYSKIEKKVRINLDFDLLEKPLEKIITATNQFFTELGDQPYYDNCIPNDNFDNYPDENDFDEEEFSEKYNLNFLYPACKELIGPSVLYKECDEKSNLVLIPKRINYSEEGQRLNLKGKELTEYETTTIGFNRFLEKAFLNTAECCGPLLLNAEISSKGINLYPDESNDIQNPLDKDFRLQKIHKFYVLINDLLDGGARSLFYEGIFDRIGEILDDSYIVIPINTSFTVIAAEKEVTKEDIIYLTNLRNHYLIKEPDLRFDMGIYKYTRIGDLSHYDSFSDVLKRFPGLIKYHID